MKRCIGFFFFCLWPWAAGAAGAASGLEPFQGVWVLNMESTAWTGNLAAAPNDFKGLRVTVDAAGRRLRLEWPDAEARNCRATVLKAEPARVSFRMEGFDPVLVMEKADQSRMRLMDRGEALLFDLEKGR